MTRIMIGASTRVCILRLAVWALLAVGAQQVQAGLVPPGWVPSSGGGPATGPIDSFVTFSISGGPDAAYGSLTTADLGGGTLAATGGTLTVTSGLDIGTYTLYANPSSPNTVLSPTGAFTYDDLIFPASNPQLDGYGLLFANTGSGAAGVQEVNIFVGNSPGGYEFYSYNGSGYNVADDPSLLLVVHSTPEPSSMTLGVWAIASFAGMGWFKRWRASVA